MTTTTLSDLRVLAITEKRVHPDLAEEIDGIVAFAEENIKDGAEETTECEAAALDIEIAIDMGEKVR